MTPSGRKKEGMFSVLNRLLIRINCCLFFLMMGVVQWKVSFHHSADCQRVSEFLPETTFQQKGSLGENETPQEKLYGDRVLPPHSGLNSRAAPNELNLDRNENIGLSDQDEDQNQDQDSSQPFRPRFKKEQLHFAAGLAQVNKKYFMDAFHFGYPERPSFMKTMSEHALLFYGSTDAIPPLSRKAATNGNVDPPLITDPHEATSLCDVMHVVVTGSDRHKRCLVVMDHYESHHVEMWKREQPEEPLKVVSRNTWTDPNKVTEDYQVKPPRKEENNLFYSDLRAYLNNMDQSLLTLGTLLKPIAIHNTVIVLVSNQGQASMLINFHCAAQAHNIPLSNVIVICIDEETKRIAESLGFAAFHDKGTFERIPSASAEHFGDYSFTAIVWAKVVAAHLVSCLGYNFLFTDVDVVWYKDPMKFFLDTSRRESQFDLLFQDDGVRTPIFAPFAANSGFYFARYNDRTLEFFTAVLLSGSQITRRQNDQSVFGALLMEHCSLFGLRVKTLQEEDFPGGRFVTEPDQREWLIQVLRQDVIPWVFHMNWTGTTEEKLQKLKQLGMWYVQHSCVAEEVDTASCCMVEPSIECSMKKLPCASDYRLQRLIA